ncbi:MAG: type II secretion system protein N [Pseudomonadota bacterium]
MSSQSLESVGGSKRLRLFVETALTVGLAILIARLIWLLVAPGSVTPTNPITFNALSGQSSSIVAVPADRSLLVKRNPFVRSAVSSSEQAPHLDQNIDAPETELNLRLTGIRALSGGDDAGSVWVIKPDGEEVLVGVGDAIMDGVTLEQIQTDRVTIRSRGRLETLSRRNDDDSFLGAAGAGDRVTTGGSYERRDQNTNGPAVGEPVGAMALYSGTNFRPVIDGGRVLGYQLSPRGGSIAFRQAGFQAGDLLLSLNGMSVEIFEDEDFIEFFIDQSRMEALVERNGVEVIIQLTLTEDT